MITHIHPFGISVQIYWLMYFLGFITIFLFNAFYGKKYGLNPKKGFLFTVVSYIAIYLWAYILAWIESGFKNWGHHNAVRVYVWMPVVLLLVAKLFKTDWRKSCEFIAPSTCIVYGIARLGCLFPGCCYGYPCEWGIYSNEAGMKVFPVQLCEAVTSLVIAGVVLYIAWKKGYSARAKTYPIMLILYGSTRFIWEFFCDNEKVFLNISALAMHAALMFIVGIISFIVLSAKDKKEPETAKTKNGNGKKVKKA